MAEITGSSTSTADPHRPLLSTSPSTHRPTPFPPLPSLPAVPSRPLSAPHAPRSARPYALVGPAAHAQRAQGAGGAYSWTARPAAAGGRARPGGGGGRAAAAAVQPADGVRQLRPCAAGEETACDDPGTSCGMLLMVGLGLGSKCLCRSSRVGPCCEAADGQGVAWLAQTDVRNPVRRSCWSASWSTRPRAARASCRAATCPPRPPRSARKWPAGGLRRS
jgi:hypothetical protein